MFFWFQNVGKYHHRELLPWFVSKSVCRSFFNIVYFLIQLCYLTNSVQVSVILDVFTYEGRPSFGISPFLEGFFSLYIKSDKFLPLLFPVSTFAVCDWFEKAELITPFWVPCEHILKPINRLSAFCLHWTTCLWLWLRPFLITQKTNQFLVFLNFHPGYCLIIVEK